MKVNVLRKRVNDSQGMESTSSVWIMAVTNHRSQLFERKRKRKQLGWSWFSMKSDLLLCIYYYIYIIYILYIYNKFSTSIFSLLANCFRFRFHSVSSPRQNPSLLYDTDHSAWILTSFTTPSATGINAPTISVDNDAWYTIDGRKLDKKPVTKGLYIHNGKKFVMEH